MSRNDGPELVWALGFLVALVLLGLLSQASSECFDMGTGYCPGY